MKGLKYRSYILKHTSHAFTFYTSRLYNSCVLLTSAIDSIYNQEWEDRGVLPFMKDELIHFIEEDTYVISPPKYFVFKRQDIQDFMLDMLFFEDKRGFIWMEESVDSNWFHVYKPSNSCDLLLLMALSRVLLSLMDSPPYVILLNDYKYSHYDFLNRLQKVVRLYKLDLSLSYKNVNKSSILQNIRLLGCIDGVVLNLISDLFDQPVYNVCANTSFPCHGIPLLGEITNVIFHLFLTNVFDRKMVKSYPGLTYSRLGHEVFIATRANDEFIFDKNEAESLLSDINLYGEIEFIEPDDNNYLLGSDEEKLIFLESDGSVSVWNSEEV